MPDPILIPIEFMGGLLDGFRLELPSLPEKMDIEAPPWIKTSYRRTPHFTTEDRVISSLVWD